MALLRIDLHLHWDDEHPRKLAVSDHNSPVPAQIVTLDPDDLWWPSGRLRRLHASAAARLIEETIAGSPTANVA